MASSRGRAPAAARTRTWKSVKIPPPAGTSFSDRRVGRRRERRLLDVRVGLHHRRRRSRSSRTARSSALKHGKARFDATGLEVTQHFVTSQGRHARAVLPGRARRTSRSTARNPTVIEGYGGFEISLTPCYNSIAGVAWLEKGGVYVVPNLRGGGEYGPKWHEAATKLNRQRVYEDFAAIAEDLIARKVTSARRSSASWAARTAACSSA